MFLIRLYCTKCRCDFYIPETPDNLSKEHIHEYCGTKLKIKYKRNKQD